MTAREVMKTLEISKMTLHNYVKAGKISIDKIINSRVIEYNAESVKRLAEASGRKTAMSGIIIYRNGKKMEIHLDDDQISFIIDTVKSKFLETV